MGRASKFLDLEGGVGRFVKYEWPGTPEVVIEEVSVISVDDDGKTTNIKKKVIVEATDTRDGQRWTGTNPPKYMNTLKVLN